MLKILSPIAICLIAFFASGCAIPSTAQFTRTVELSELFQNPMERDGEIVCSVGFLRIGEAITIHSTEYEAKNSPFETAVVLGLVKDGIVSISRQDEFKRMEFCGRIDLQSSCWLGAPEDDQDFCVPIKRPIHIVVESARVI